MNSQQLLDYIIKPTLEYMGGNYNSKNAQMLLLATAAIESKCGHYIKQINGPALGIWQMEPETHGDIWLNCDKLQGYKYSDNKVISHRIIALMTSPDNDADTDLIVSPMYACAMARLKYSIMFYFDYLALICLLILTPFNRQAFLFSLAFILSLFFYHTLGFSSEDGGLIYTSATAIAYLCFTILSAVLKFDTVLIFSFVAYWLTYFSASIDYSLSTGPNFFDIICYSYYQLCG